jgi:quercetin dioxygenase-like cupin family protein
VKYTRIYSDPVGESHFEDVEVALKLVDFSPPAPPAQLASPLPAEQVILLSVPPEFHGDWHPVPRRQLYVQLSGKIEVTVSDGETRVFRAGDVVLGEDVSGKGHVTRVRGTAEAQAAIVQLA